MTSAFGQCRKIKTFEFKSQIPVNELCEYKHVIVINSNFSGILDDWLSSRGLSRPDEDRRRRPVASSKSLPEWTEEVHAAVALAPGPARGLEIGSFVQLRHTGPLGYIAVNSKSLGEFFETYLMLEKWFYGENWAAKGFGEGQFEVAWDQRIGVPDRLVEQLHAIALVTVIRRAFPKAGSPLRVEVMNDEMGEGNSYERAFGCQVSFGRPALRLVLPIAALRAPLDFDNLTNKTTQQHSHRTFCDRLSEETVFVRAVQEAILHHLHRGAPTSQVAADLKLSRRTLQRRLADSGCTYRQLREGIRERYANRLMADENLSFREIAFLLGYSEQSAFNHACQRWTGLPPSKARR